jgi:hypothetical protein
MIYNSSLQHKSANLHQILVFYLANTRAAYKSSLQGALHCCCSLLLFFSFELLFSSLNSIFFSFFKQKQLQLKTNYFAVLALHIMIISLLAAILLLLLNFFIQKKSKKSSLLNLIK